MSDDRPLGRTWSQLEMASVLSNWYGYNIHHNIFNVANFIEYEPLPKRRKLDKSNNYLSTEQPELVCVDTPTNTTTRVRSHHVSYRPYSDVQQVKQKSSRQKTTKSEVVTKVRVQVPELPTEGTKIDDLYPEILCLIFEKLDWQSKGRVAQVRPDTK